ncbi:MAG: hypothetical protein Edafosvirus2_23 [Edafosvirus sp.]|uniref:Uncharacterized protein n=1 Tax=Edafosvirus sp. TaxID=2487765 RepID=A0A3G4ZU52_9VIRU|nr:MAG: hypothetical protein Edafosvirus2_23 [Edafosvirus sp.]
MVTKTETKIGDPTTLLEIEGKSLRDKIIELNADVQKYCEKYSMIWNLSNGIVASLDKEPDPGETKMQFLINRNRKWTNIIGELKYAICEKKKKAEDLEHEEYLKARGVWHFLKFRFDLPKELTDVVVPGSDEEKMQALDKKYFEMMQSVVPKFVELRNLDFDTYDDMHWDFGNTVDLGQDILNITVDEKINRMTKRNEKLTELCVILDNNIAELKNDVAT